MGRSPVSAKVVRFIVGSTESTVRGFPGCIRKSDVQRANWVSWVKSTYL